MRPACFSQHAQDQPQNQEKTTMPIDTHPKRKAPNTEQVVEEQKRQARQLKAAASSQERPGHGHNRHAGDVGD
jgi:hypothetical protein